MESHTELLRCKHTVVIVIGQGKDAQQHRLRQAGLAEHLNGGVSLDQTGGNGGWNVQEERNKLRQKVTSTGCC